MKKAFTLLIAAAMLSSAVAVPVFAENENNADTIVAEEISSAVDEESVDGEETEEEAENAILNIQDYTEADYDEVRQNITYDDGTVENTIDGSKAKKFEDKADVFRYSTADGPCTMFTKEFFLSFDFMIDTADADKALFGINRTDDNGKNVKIGPMFSYSGGQIRTQTSSNKYQTLGAMSLDTWYTAELEGKMTVSGAAVTFRLYQYVDGTKTLVNEAKDLNLRNFSSGSSNGNPNFMYAQNVNIDNVKLISENANELVLTASADEINAGAASTLDYTAYRQEQEVTKPSVTWSVYDEANENPISDKVSISGEGVLVADIAAESQTVTVRATVVYESKKLVGTKQIKINAVNTDNEKFDTIKINGDTAVKTGTETTYTYTALKNGEDVTANVTDADVVWSVYDYNNINVNSNINIKASKGVLTVNDGVLPQNITLRASSASGNVYDSKSIAIDFGASQKETVLASDACEMPIDTAELVDSWDGSKAYKTTSATKLVQLAANQADQYVMVSLDAKFDGEGSGFTFLRRDAGKTNNCFRYHNGAIAMQTDSSNYSNVMTAETGKWYHFEVLYKGNSGSIGDSSCNIYEYNEDGTLGSRKTTVNISRRQGKEFGLLQIENSTAVDNVLITLPIANEITAKAEKNSMFIGETNQISATASRNGMPLNDYSDITWSVFDWENLPILDDKITVDGNGLVTVSSMANPQNITVVAKTATAESKVSIEIQSSDIFTVTNLGVNEEKTKITKMYVTKNLYYADDVTFIITIKDKNGVLKKVSTVKSFGDSYSIGENEVVFDLTLPSDFNATEDVIDAMVWTLF